MKSIKPFKAELKEIAAQAKLKYPSDKPIVRAIINDSVDYICKDNQLTEHQRDLLSNYACKLHPKD